LALDDERKRRKAFKAAVGMAGTNKPPIIIHRVIFFLIITSTY
jgi:hypothetical protein